MYSCMYFKRNMPDISLSLSLSFLSLSLSLSFLSHSLSLSLSFLSLSAVFTTHGFILSIVQPDKENLSLTLAA